ncbi:MAG: hypothetical protein KDD47_05070, partial [Acidobacteria bacterium]|nr:hypothetical protein [Acidobacteriota bacterium]
MQHGHGLLKIIPLPTLGVLALALLGACSPPARQEAADPAAITEGVEKAAAAITAEGLQEVIGTLASDDFEGRGPATEGDRKAQQYIAETFAAAGLSPGAEDGGWLQRFGVVGITAQAPETWSFSGADGTADFRWWDEYIASSGVQDGTSSVEDAEVVFVGYGIDAPEHDWDDYKGVDVSGKVLLMLNNDPDWDP